LIVLKKDKNTLLKISNERKSKGDIIGAVSVLLNDKPYAKKDIEIYYALGKLYLESKNYNLAIYNFLKYSQFADKKGRCKAYNAIGYAFLLEKNKFLANNFFNEQLEISYKQECDFSAEMYDFFTEEEKEINKFKAVKQSEDELIFQKASYFMTIDKYQDAIDGFNQIKNSSKFYGQSLYYKGIAYFLLEDKQKGLANLREYFNHFSPSVSEYLDFINLLSANNMSERDYYIEELLKVTPKTAKEYFYIAETLFTYTDKYEKILEYIDEYNKEFPYSESAFCLKGLVYKFMGDKDLARSEIKKAYLLTHGAKYKYLMHNLDKKDYFNYPKCIKKDYQNKLIDLFEKPQKLTVEGASELVEYATEFSDDTFWMMLIALLGDCKKKFTEYYLKELLIVPKAPIPAKISAIEQLSLKGVVGKLGIFDIDGFNVIELFSQEKIQTEKFRQAYCKAYSRVAIFAKNEFFDKCIKLEQKLIKKGFEGIKQADLVGLIICYGFNNSIKAPFYKTIYSSKAKINKLLKEYELL